MAQSIVKVPKELIKLQQDVELAIDCFFVNKRVFLTTMSTKICFTTVTHLAYRTKALIWEALHATYKMYLIRGFRIVVIAGDHEFASISDLVVQLPTAPISDWAAASQHCGLIERNIRFLKEKIRSLRHSLPFERVPGIMVETVFLPSGLCTLFGPVSARWADAGVLRMSNLNEFLVDVQHGRFATAAGDEVFYSAFGDLAFNLGMQCIQSYYRDFAGAAQLDGARRKCNASMRAARVTVEKSYRQSL